MRRALLLLAAGAAIGACGTLGLLLGRREYLRWQEQRADQPLATLGASQFATRDTTSKDGLGPGFNAPSCVTCHTIPEPGGSGTIATLRVARRDPDGTHHGYPDIQVVHRNAVAGCEPVIPPDANVFSRRIPTSTFGSGLVEAIPDEALIALEDPQDRDGDGVSGRAARVRDRASGAERIGRFGWKAQHATLLAFSAEAYLTEMGITTDLYRVDRTIGLTADRQRRCEAVEDPEDQLGDTGFRSIDLLAAFMRSLPAATSGAVVPDGERLFIEAGCHTCHRPQIGEVRAFSDYLLHDIGTGDGIREADAAPEEMRTAALWGIRDRSIYLHDGSAHSIDAAIARHDREAGAARQRFLDLPESQRRALVAFVSTR